MFKSLFVALALVTAIPAFANDAQDLNNVESPAVDADLRIDFGPGGVDIGWSPGRRPHWGRPGRPPMIGCVAQNGRGIRFFGRGWDDNQAARQALHQCRTSYDTYNPRTCRVVGCRYVQ